MKIAELFIQLGVKGDDSAKKAVDGVTQKMGEVKSISLGAKAAIIGVVYGLERLMSKSAKVGTGLRSFTALTGLSTIKLQQMEFAAQKLGLANGVVERTVISLQAAIAKMRRGKGAPEGLAELVRITGADTKRLEDTFYLMKKLQELALSDKVSKEQGNLILSSFVGEDMIAAFRKRAFTQGTMAGAPIYSAVDQKRLQEVNKEWFQIFNLVEKTIGKLTAKHGLEIVEDIGKTTVEINKLITSLAQLADSTQVFKHLGTIFEGWDHIFKGWILAVDALKDMSEFIQKDSPTKKEDAKNFINDLSGFILENIKSTAIPMGAGGYMPTGESSKQMIEGVMKNIITPNRLIGPTNNNKQDVNVNMTQTYSHEGKNAAIVASDTAKIINDTFRQMGANAQVS